MENSTQNISPNEKNGENNIIKTHETNEALSESLDTIAFFLFEAIKRKSNKQLQRKGA